MRRVSVFLFSALLVGSAQAGMSLDTERSRCEGCEAAPAEVVAHAGSMAEECRAVGAKPFSGPVVEHGRFRNGPEFWAINEETFRCKGAETLFSTNHGASVVVFVKTSGGHAVESFNQGAFGLVLERTGDASRIWIGVGGPLCGQVGTDRLSTAEMRLCERPLQWDAEARKIGFAPLSERRPFNQGGAAEVGGSIGNLYDSGAELDSPRTYVLAEYWKDKIDRIAWKDPVAKRGKIFNGALPSPDGRLLMVSLLQTPSVCGERCPVRVFTAKHRMIMDLSVCSDRTRHGISADRSAFMACGETFPIPQVDERTALLENAPPGAHPEAYLEVQRRVRAQPANGPKPVRVDSALHNGSQMLISEWKDGAVEITYDVPRPGLPVAQGTVVFRGTRKGAQYQGTAFTFKNGCSPAPYAVGGVRDGRRELLVLAGVAPRRGAACQIIGGSATSGHARLVFDTRELGDY